VFLERKNKLVEEVIVSLHSKKSFWNLLVEKCLVVANTERRKYGEAPYEIEVRHEIKNNPALYRQKLASIEEFYKGWVLPEYCGRIAECGATDPTKFGEVSFPALQHWKEALEVSNYLNFKFSSNEKLSNLYKSDNPTPGVRTLVNERKKSVLGIVKNAFAPGIIQ
jgi:hypothetical protein